MLREIFNGRYKTNGHEEENMHSDDGGVRYSLPGTCLHGCTELEGVQGVQAESGTDREDYIGDEGV